MRAWLYVIGWLPMVAFATSNVHTCGPLLIPIRFEGGRATLDGANIDLYHWRPLHVSGTNNDGIYRSTYRGQPVVLKRRDGHAWMDYAKSAPGPLIGGPRMVGIARPAYGRDDSEAYVVMEELFPNEPSVTFKGLSFASPRERSAAARRMISGPADTRLTRQLADGIAQGLLFDILPPYDFDFIMTTTALRLLDVDSLTFGRLATRVNSDRDFVHAVLRLISRKLELNLDPDVARMFREDFLSALSALIDDDERFARVGAAFDEVYDEKGKFIEITGARRRREVGAY